MEDARATQQVDIGQGEAFVEEIIGSVTRNPDALISLSKLRTYDEYTFTHCINVAVLTLGFAEFFGIHRTELRALGIAALFHDIGKARIPNAVLNKPGRLSDEEFAVMRRHPLLSYQLLRDNEHGGSSLDPDVLHGIVEHHEKHNGKGYPRGLKDDAIHIYGRVIALADVYDALTSARVYKPAMPPTKALQIMFEMRDKDFRATDVSMFIKFLGIYPVGSLVRLSDGHHGVVSEANREDVRRPRVLVAFDRDLAPAPRQVVDLAEHTDLAIAEGLDHREHGIDPMALLAA
jgi:HD-GYP domain-containing protein (c-di-GMP phosphodiesterase class II)